MVTSLAVDQMMVILIVVLEALAVLTPLPALAVHQIMLILVKRDIARSAGNNGADSGVTISYVL